MPKDAAEALTQREGLLDQVVRNLSPLIHWPSALEPLRSSPLYRQAMRLWINNELRQMQKPNAQPTREMSNDRRPSPSAHPDSAR